MIQVELKNKARENIVNAIIERLEVGDIIWEKGWGTLEVPFNANTKIPYRGVNNFILSVISELKGYNDPRWLTFNQAKEKGYKVKEGSKATYIEVFKRIDKETKKEVTREDLIRLRSEMSPEEFEEYVTEKTYLMCKNYGVFNAEQISGIEKYSKKTLSNTEIQKRNENIENILNNSEAMIFYDEKDSAYYSPSDDEIHLPKREAFHSLESFYTTALHEIAHSTGHESRLNRNLKLFFGTANYAKEELVAEFSSVFISRDLNLESTTKQFDNHAAYIKNWLSLLHENPNALFDAIKLANEASDYVISFADKKEEKKEIQESGIQVKIPFSESGYFKDEVTLPFFEAETILTTLNEYSDDFGYYKTDFIIQKDGKDMWEGRYDIGSESGGIAKHIKEFIDYSKEDYKNRLKQTDNEEARKTFKQIIKSYEEAEEMVLILNNEHKNNFDLKKVEIINKSIYSFAKENNKNNFDCEVISKDELYELNAKADRIYEKKNEFFEKMKEEKAQKEKETKADERVREK